MIIRFIYKYLLLFFILFVEGYINQIKNLFIKIRKKKNRVVFIMI